MGTITSSAVSTLSVGKGVAPDPGRASSGLSSTEAQRRLSEFGPNDIRREQCRYRWPARAGARVGGVQSGVCSGNVTSLEHEKARLRHR